MKNQDKDKIYIRERVSFSEGYTIILFSLGFFVLFFIFGWQLLIDPAGGIAKSIHSFLKPFSGGATHGLPTSKIGQGIFFSAFSILALLVGIVGTFPHITISYNNENLTYLPNDKKKRIDIGWGEIKEISCNMGLQSKKNPKQTNIIIKTKEEVYTVWSSYKSYEELKSKWEELNKTADLRSSRLIQELLKENIPENK